MALCSDPCHFSGDALSAIIPGLNFSWQLGHSRCSPSGCGIYPLMNRALKLFAFSLAFYSPAAIPQTTRSQPTTPDAQVRLGNEYLEKHDYGMAMTWFRKAADQGNAAGENNVGWFYEKGFGVTQNYAEALNCWHMTRRAELQMGMPHWGSRGLGTLLGTERISLLP